MSYKSDFETVFFCDIEIVDNVAINAGKYLQTVVLDNLGTRVPGHVFRQTPDGQEWYYCWRPDFTALLALVNDAAGSGYLLDYANLVRLDLLRPSTVTHLEPASRRADPDGKRPCFRSAFV
jgi:hypothetical protein